jgi:L-glyceraldehyde 3-phosphate reductase
MFLKKKEALYCISPLRKGLLTDKYLKDSGKLKAFSPNGHLKLEVSAKVQKIKALNEKAEQRNQSLAQMALAWL